MRVSGARNASRSDASPFCVSPSAICKTPSVYSHQPGELLVCTLDSACNEDRKSTRLNSSHGYISYAVFCLKKKKNNQFLNTSDLLQIYTYQFLCPTVPL